MADHQGVPNSQLVAEGTAYHNRSVAEQNSIDVAWTIFMKDQYQDLRSTICASPFELQRLRQLVVNSVIATDIMDHDLNQERNERWNHLFGQPNDSKNNTKATAILEHLI